MSAEPFFPQEIIRRKRDGAALLSEEIEFMVRGIADGSVSEGQVAAFAMAVFFRGMKAAECAALTQAMASSGHRLDWSQAGLPGPVLDKHSTGGIGDKVSLILAPIVAACGGFVPMISGRGLGHTGGTLDKLSSIPGYDAAPDAERFRRVVREAGCAIIGQTADIAPADRRLYAIRDVTATVESIPLITASILSKKLAAGLDALVMDVKFGSGAFAAEVAMATALAESIVATAADAGLRITALLTDMDQALGVTAGNALEVRESIDLLTTGRGDTRLIEVTLALSAELLCLGGLAADDASARHAAERALASGAAAERFARMIAALGGPTDFVERKDRYLATAPVRRAVEPSRPGIIAKVDARALGLAVMALGGGRRRAEDGIDVAVGLDELRGPGDAVNRDLPIAIVHARSNDDADLAATMIRTATVVSDAAPPARPVILRRIAQPDNRSLGA